MEFRYDHSSHIKYEKTNTKIKITSRARIHGPGDPVVSK